MLRIFVQTTDDDYVLHLEGDVENILTAGHALVEFVPTDSIITNGRDGLVRVRGEASLYLHAWLRAVEATHRATTIVWLPVATTA
jgi:hypothetical protein